MSWGNLAKALHDELCEAFDCVYDMPDLDTGLPVRVRQTGHRYPREFWEGMAQAVIDDYRLMAANRVTYDARQPSEGHA